MRPCHQHLAERHAPLLSFCLGLTVRGETDVHEKVSESKGHGHEIGLRLWGVAIIGRTIESIEGEMKVSFDRACLDGGSQEGQCWRVFSRMVRRAAIAAAGV